MRSRSRTSIALATLLAVAPLTSSCHGARPDVDGRASVSLGRTITGEEIARSGVLNAYDAVSHLRPQLLAGRGPTSVRSTRSEAPEVYVDGLLAPGLETLTQIPASQVLEIKYLSAAEAMNRFGNNHLGGALLVRTGRRQ